MSRFRLLRHLLATTGGGGGLLSPTYDTRFGTATDANGWITFGLNGSNKRIWLDSVNGNDANNGLTAATAKATWAAATALWLGGGWVSGDQLMVAGGQSQTYTDTGATTWAAKGGISATYPTVVQSYDSTDPSNAAKYGALTGAKMPSLSISSSGQTLVDLNANISSNFAVKGIEFNGTGGLGTNATGFINFHSNLAYQNCRFKEAGAGFDSSTGSRISNTHFSKCSFWLMYCSSTAGGGAIGNCQAIYLGNIDSAYVQDNVFAHCGWARTAARGDAASSGGPTQFSHAHYYHASGINGRFDRNVYVDTAHDGLNIRGSAAATCIVTLDEPLPGKIGGFSSSDSEAPSGVTITVDDWLIMGGAADSNIPGAGNGPDTENTVLGSYIKNVVMIDNPARSGANSIVFPSHSTSIIDQYLLMNNVRTYNYAGGLETSGSNAQIHDTWLNCLVDSLSFTLPTTTLTNTGVHSGLTTYPGALTRDQIVTAVLTAAGLTPSGVDYAHRKAQLENIMIWRPDVNWAQKFLDIGLPAYGTTPQYASATLPNLSAETPRTVF